MATFILPDSQEWMLAPLPPLFNWGFSGPRSVLSLGIQNDTGAVLFFSALESGVSLLQILYHRQQPSCNALT